MRSPRTEYSTCSSNARSSFSGAIEARPLSAQIALNSPFEPLQRLIDPQPKRPQRVIGRHEVLQLRRRAQRFLHLVHSAHRSHLSKAMNTISLTHRSQHSFTSHLISMAC